MLELQNRCHIARDLLENGGAHLIDVRSEAEFAQGALHGAKNIPLNNLSKAPHLLDKAANIIVYCASGLRSKNAHEILTNHGFENIYDLGSFKTLQFC